MPTLPDPYPHQLSGRDFLQQHRRALLADDPGLGKTRTMLMAAEGETLVVATALLLSEVWAGEIERWRPDLASQITTCSYGMLPDKVADSRGRMTKSVDRLREALRRPWDTVIFDESHRLKNRETMWTKAVLRDLRTEQLFLATGTPVPNWAHEIFTTLRLLYPGDRRFTNYWRWVKTWFYTWQPPYGGTKIEGLLGCMCNRGVDCEHWLRFADENGLVGRMRRVERSVVHLPPLTLVPPIEVEMEREQARVYKELKRDYLAWVESVGVEVLAWSDGALHTKLMQVQTGLETLGIGASSSGKLRALREMLEDLAGRPVVIFTHFRNSAGAAAQVAAEAGRRAGVVMGGQEADNRAAVRAFKAGELDTLVGTYDSMAEGLTLTQADICIRLERHWRPSANEQAIRRIHRIGQQHPVTVYDLVTKGSLEQRQLQVLEGKTDQQVRLMRATEFASLL